MRSLHNPQRGCGHLKAGGFYARGSFGMGGTLNAWTWALGSHIIGSLNLLIEVAPRLMQVIKLPETLQAGRFISATSDEQIEITHPALKRLPKLAILDHVGSRYYTPSEFAHEVDQYCASRRIPEQIAGQLAGHTPIPVFFVHSKMPHIEREHADEFRQWVQTTAWERQKAHALAVWESAEAPIVPSLLEEQLQPSFINPNWGLRSADDNGSAHWIIQALRVTSAEAGHKSKDLYKTVPPTLRKALMPLPAIFGASWFTDLVYVVDGTESKERLNEIQGHGVEPVMVEEAT